MLRAVLVISLGLFALLHTPDYSWSDERSTSTVKMTAEEKSEWGKFPGTAGLFGSPIGRRLPNASTIINLRKNDWFDPNALRQWRNSVEDEGGKLAIRWANEGFTPSDALWCIRTGIDPDEARQWAATELTDIEWWVDAGFSPDAAAKWAVVGYVPPEAAALARADVQPGEAKPWREAGLDAQDVLHWVRAGFHPIDEFWEWAKSGVSPELAAKWAKATDRPDALAWASEQFDPDEAKQWWDIQGVSPVEAREFHGLGVEPRAAREIKDKRCMGAPIENGIYDINPFVATGKCFFLTGQVLQLLDRTVALVQSGWSSSDIIRLDFTPNASPAEGKSIHVIGMAKEPFRYTTVRGDESTIADIAVIAARTMF